MTKRLLILDPEGVFSAIANAAARSAGWDSQHIDNPEEALKALSSETFGALLLAVDIKGGTSADFLKEVRQIPGRSLLDVIFLGEFKDFGRRTHSLPLPLPAADLSSLLKSLDVKPGELNLEMDAFEEAMFRITGEEEAKETEEEAAKIEEERVPDKLELSEDAIEEMGALKEEQAPVEVPSPIEEEEDTSEVANDEEPSEVAPEELPEETLTEEVSPAVEEEAPSRSDKILFLEEGWILTDKGGDFDLFAFRVDKDEVDGAYKEPAFGLAETSEPSEDEKLEAALQTIEEEVDEDEALKALDEKAEEAELTSEEPQEQDLSQDAPPAEVEEEPSYEDEKADAVESAAALFASDEVEEDENKRLEEAFLSLALAEEGEADLPDEDTDSGRGEEAALPVVEEELKPAEETIPESEPVSFLEDSVAEEELLPQEELPSEDEETLDLSAPGEEEPQALEVTEELPVIEEELKPAEATIPESEPISFLEDSVAEEELLPQEELPAEDEETLDLSAAGDEEPQTLEVTEELPVAEEELKPAEETTLESEPVSFLEDSVAEEELLLEEAPGDSEELDDGQNFEEFAQESESLKLEETFQSLTAEFNEADSEETPEELSEEEELEAADALATELVKAPDDDIFAALDDAMDAFEEAGKEAIAESTPDEGADSDDPFDLGIEFDEGEELFTEPIRESKEVELEAEDMPAPFPDDDPFAAELALEFHDSTHRDLIDFSFDRAESEVGITATQLAPDFEKLKADENLPELESLHPAPETQSIIPETDLDDSWAVSPEEDDSFELDFESYFDKFERED
ncbi:MAG: hypothetical protein C0608_06545 [Deltaproteobacteria bacterium]|nr:MAG: hypothetical protein C0608_06545 [Deltaproteobacteria bacterium]